MLRTSIACVLSISLAGCVTLKTASPSDPMSGWKKTETKFEVADGRQKKIFDFDENLDKEQKTDAVTGTYADAEKVDPEFYALFDDVNLCGTVQRPKLDPNLTGPFVVPILITVVTSAISYWNVRQQQILEDRREAAKRSSNGKIVLSPGELNGAKCVVFTRKAQDPRLAETSQDGRASKAETKDLTIVMRIERKKAGKNWSGQLDHFSLTPIFARAYSSISETKKGGTIDLAIGLTLHQIVSISGVPTLANLGVAGTAIEAVPLTGVPQCAPPAKPSPCSTSNILPLPRDEGTIVLGLAVQEIGDLGFDVDLAKAQGEAIAGAMGPLAGTLLKDHFDREAERAKQ